MNHILQSVIVEQPHTFPFRIVLHKLHGVKLCTHMETLTKEPIDHDGNETVYLYHHDDYCHGHYHDNPVCALTDFARRCEQVNAKLDHQEL